MKRVVVVGAGVGGLTTAAVLARAGLDVPVLEAHVYPDGCAGTFYHQGYRFDAGATLAAGFYPGGPMDLVARAAGITSWPAHPAKAALVVHLPDGASVTRWTDERRSDEHRQVFGAGAESFWRWQESTADVLWDLALRTPPWPPRSMDQALRLAGVGAAWLGRDLRRLNPSLAADAFRPVAAHLHGASERLRLFADGQLLIAVQTTSRHANALYGASALDLPRRGVVHLEGGIGTLATTLAQAVRADGGQVHLRQEVTRIRRNADQTWTLETKRRDAFPADEVIVNLPPWNAAALMGDDVPRSLKHLPLTSRDGWGAFMLYVGLDGSAIPRDFPLHHQVIVREPMGEGNTVFLSLSPAWDAKRAPKNKRALTISTHTDLSTWWPLYEHDRAAYQARKAEYVERMLNAAQVALPRLRESAEMILPGTPATFERFTRRVNGWVGGFPQTTLFRAWSPRLAPNL